ncbi:MAG TPA: AsmA family protein, partial [Noviherbaspirillum sp.]|nr:AsmA family protein [Noviherbaspirillum sp.]
MRTAKKAWIWIGGGLVALLALIVVLLTVINWNFARPWLAERIEDGTGRSFAIHGDLEVRWRAPEQMQTGWRRFAPWPHFRAHQIELGNPEWAETGPNMLTVPQVDFTLNPLALLRRHVTISSLLFTDPELALEINEDGENNWTFRERDPESRWEVELEDLFLNNGTVRLLNRARPADVTARVQTGADGSATFELEGNVAGEEVSGGGKVGALLGLREDRPFPAEARVTIGDSEITAAGTVTNPRQPSALDVQLNIKGASMAQLFPFTGIALPHRPRFSTEGRVVGSLARDGLHLRYEDFSGKVGSSDIGGTLEYLRREPRPLLRGKVVSQRLDLDDLGALLGADDEKARKRRGEDWKQPEGRVLPARPFGTDRWDQVDV